MLNTVVVDREWFGNTGVSFSIQCGGLGKPLTRWYFLFIISAICVFDNYAEMSFAFEFISTRRILHAILFPISEFSTTGGAVQRTDSYSSSKWWTGVRSNRTMVWSSSCVKSIRSLRHIQSNVIRSTFRLHPVSAFVMPGKKLLALSERDGTHFI